ncbi:hypothetical protein GCM10010498_30210 [Streptomyces cavourensis]|nr:hypothetical protein GCM10010498_30210 [Streptomyces cavourensis]
MSLPSCGKAACQAPGEGGRDGHADRAAQPDLGEPKLINSRLSIGQSGYQGSDISSIDVQASPVNKYGE